MKKIISLVLVLVLALTAIGGTLAYFTDEDETKNTFVTGNVKLDLYEHKYDDDKNELSKTEEVESNDYKDAMVPGHVFAKDPTIELLKQGETTTTGEEATYDSQPAYVYLDMTMNKHKSLFPVMALDALENDLITEDQFKGCVDGETFKASKFVALMVQNKDVFQKIIDRWFTGIEHTKWQLMDIFYDHADGDVTAKATKGAERLTFRFAYIGDNDETPTIMEAGDKIQFMSAFQMPATVTQDMIENNMVKNDFSTAGEAFHLDFKAYAIQADMVGAEGTQLDIKAAYANLFTYGIDGAATSFKTLSTN